VQVSDAEVLLDDVSDFGDGFVTQNLRVGQLSGGGVFAHDAVSDLIECQEVPVGFSGVAFISIDFFDLLLGMTTENGAIGQEVSIVDRVRSQCGGHHKAVARVYRGMLLQPEVRGLIFDPPVGFEIAGELQRFAVFIMVPFLGLAVLRCSFQLVVAPGAACRLDQAGIHGNAFVDGEPLLLELTQDLGVDRVHGGFGNRPRKREKVEWSGAGWLKARPRKVLKESWSLIWFSSSGSDWIRNYF
jgi:hypothetical protein